ncbi:MAG TPA: MFS transporter [Candidatus Limnocylindrales bacterium]|nr:MFS transporter [Candidatus Limnocylindrales bacterium]
MAFMAHEAAHLDQAAIASARTRTRWALFLGVAIGSTGHIAAVTVGAIVGAELLGNKTLAGAPGAAITMGAALGAIGLSWLMARRGRRLGLTSGYLVGLLGATLAVLAVVSRSFPLLILGTFLIGFGNSSNNLSRYAAADLVHGNERSVAIGSVVWGSTIGGIVGPLLVPVSFKIAAAIGLPEHAGPYLVPMFFVTIAATLSYLLLRPDPFALAYEAHVERPADHVATPVRSILLRPSVIGAFVALIAGQVTMTLIMTMTPIHLEDHHHPIEVVGVVISAHVMGMFAFAPISGLITRRFGALSTILLGSVVLISSSMLAALAPPDNSALLTVALFLLGWGWNLGFVAGSTMLSSGVDLSERARVQGVADAVIWTTAAAASLGSGAVVAAAGYTTLGFIGVAIVLLPVWLLLTRRNEIVAAARPA